MEGSKAFVLQHGGKASFFDCHRQFLPLNHPYRRQKDKFKKGVIERSPPPPRLSGDVIQNRVNSLPDIVFGTTSGKQTIPGFGVHHNWWLKDLRLPDGYASNIARAVSVEDCKFFGLKSHDCHILMQRLIPIAFRDILPKAVWDELTELSHFFRDITAIILFVDNIEILEKNIIETICKLEKIFPPGFFDSMDHLPIHIAYEAKVGGPVQYRWMYPFERFLFYLKKKVQNKASVEGSIVEAYIIEEISTFCSHHFEPQIPIRLNKVPRNDDGGNIEPMGRISIFTHSGRPFGRIPHRRIMSNEEYSAAHIYVLLNSYVEKNEVEERIYQIAQGPGRTVQSYKGYFVNGFKFHTHDYGRDRKTLNSGVWVKGSCYNEYESDYYNLLNEVLQLEYFGVGNNIILFKCEWFDTNKGIRVHPQNGHIEIHPKSRLASNDPFILALQAQQQEDDISRPLEILPTTELDDPCLLFDSNHIVELDENELQHLVQPSREDEEEEEEDEEEDEDEDENENNKDDDSDDD
ncbi:uncharacterized protein LOC131179487 [Hevea brasiliensis]|uniref:uncharacterized protein LOC131179487 n=1 Tax=Hevea brasiliensis TaxID=3981 RepID=UPI0025E9763F|nr:uncharacterized protein LOC131179487 [Hevea brasiliensis]